MSKQKILKIIVIGPSMSGKSVVTNLVSGQIDLTKVPYQPTKSMRILETDVKGIISEKKTLAKNIGVQLWDIGGEKQNQQYWNSLLYGADGIVIVYNGDRLGQEKELETILYYFTQRPDSAILKPIPESRILLVANHQRSISKARNSQPTWMPNNMVGKVKELHTNLLDDVKKIQSEFQMFINNVYNEVGTK